MQLFFPKKITFNLLIVLPWKENVLKLLKWTIYCFSAIILLCNLSGLSHASVSWCRHQFFSNPFDVLSNNCYWESMKKGWRGRLDQICCFAVKVIKIIKVFFLNFIKLWVFVKELQHFFLLKKVRCNKGNLLFCKIFIILWEYSRNGYFSISGISTLLFCLEYQWN